MKSKFVNVHGGVRGLTFGRSIPLPQSGCEGSHHRIKMIDQNICSCQRDPYRGTDRREQRARLIYDLSPAAYLLALPP
jgi:hypothetical protein